jgi:hypothetical protein
MCQISYKISLFCIGTIVAREKSHTLETVDIKSWNDGEIYEDCLEVWNQIQSIWFFLQFSKTVWTIPNVSPWKSNFIFLVWFLRLSGETNYGQFGHRLNVMTNQFFNSENFILFQIIYHLVTTAWHYQMRNFGWGTKI